MTNAFLWFSNVILKRGFETPGCNVDNQMGEKCALTTGLVAQPKSHLPVLECQVLWASSILPRRETPKTIPENDTVV